MRIAASARATPGRRALVAVLAWLVLAGAFRAAVAIPERCPEASPGDLRETVAEAVRWFERNQRPDGTWLYRYDAHDDRDLGGYNTVRHAGVAMSLYQAAAEGFEGALETADLGAEHALDHLVRHDDWAAFEPGSGPVTTGATGLLAAGLLHRREATGDPRHDEVLHDLGRFLASMVEPSGAVLAYWDREREAPRPDAYSTFYTGEAYWALTLLHRAFPEGGWDVPARRVGHYLATERDDAEDTFPRIFDHWAAYGLSVTATWPDAGPEGRPLTDAEVSYARRQAGLGGMQVRWESQRTDAWPNWWLRGHRTLGAGLGTLGESLTSLRVAAGADERLADLREPLTERVTCTAGMLVDRQIDEVEAEETADPERTRGAWFASGVTQMDDQQHALSAVLRAVPAAEARSRSDPGRSRSSGPATALLLVAVVAAVNPARVASALPSRRQRHERALLAVLGGTPAVAVLAALAWSSGPLLDWLSVSAPTVRIGAALVLAVAALRDLLARPPAPEPSLDGRRAALVPVAVPLLLRPHLLPLVVSVGADGGVAVVLLGSALAVGALVALALAPGRGGAESDDSPGPRASRWAGRVTAAVLLVVAVALTVDGVFDV